MANQPPTQSPGVVMSNAAPHYLLLCESNSNPARSGVGGKWGFVLEKLGDSERTEVTEIEPGVYGERLQLLSVVRGLEALEQPSNVTLVTSSDYVGRGIRVNLSTWRENGFQWERFGLMSPIKNRDLWMRIDHAMSFHQVECRIWNFNMNCRPLRQKTFEFDKPLESETVSSRWETSQEEAPVEATPVSLSTITQCLSDQVQNSGFRRSYGCAAS